jgi:hypothetical protein
VVRPPGVIHREVASPRRAPTLPARSPRRA